METNDEKDECLYVCKRCGEECKSKANIKAHLTKGRMCPALIMNIPREHLLEMFNEYEKLLKDYPSYCVSCFKIFPHRQAKHRHTFVCTKDINTENQQLVTSFLERYHTIHKSLFGEMVPGLISFGDDIRYRDVLDDLGYEFIYFNLNACDLVTLAEGVFFGTIAKFKCVRFDANTLKFTVYKKGFWIGATKNEVLEYIYESALLILRTFRMWYRDTLDPIQGESRVYSETKHTRVAYFLDEGHEDSKDRTKVLIMHMFLAQNEFFARHLGLSGQSH